MKQFPKFLSIFRRGNLCGLAGALILASAIEPLAAQSVAPSTATTPPAATEPAASKSVEGDEDLDRIESDASRKLLRDFKRDNPDAREHKLAQESAGSSSAFLRLESVWVGAKGTLFELTGMTPTGRPNSAVLRRDTLQLEFGKNQLSKLQASEGVVELRDRRGGAALVVKPGEKLFLLFEPIDDSRPFTMFHVNHIGGRAVYFDDLDPRFRERYDASFAKATTPDTMKEFLVEFARNDPDARAPRVFSKLIGEMRAQKSFEGFYTAYLLLEDVADAKAAQRLATTDAHRRKLEHVAITALADKSRLLDFEITRDASSTDTDEGRCWMFCRYNFTGKNHITGSLTVRARTSGSPIKLRQGSYRVSFVSEMRWPTRSERRSQILGNDSDAKEDSIRNVHSVTLSPPNYTATLPISFGSITVAFFQRGSSGGWEGSWVTGDPRISVSFHSMDLLP